MARPRAHLGKNVALGACLIALVLSGLQPAMAGQAEDAAAARDHTKRATAAYNLGHYAEAAGEFEAAYRLVLDSALLFNVAQAWRLAGQLDKALKGYRSYLRTAPPGAGDRAQAEKWKQELERNPSATREPSTTPTPAAVPPPAPVPAPLPPPPAAPPPPAPPVTAPTADASLPTIALHTPAPAPSHAESAPVYKRWWFWTLVGVAAAGVATAFILTRDHENPDCLGISPCGSLR